MSKTFILLLLLLPEVFGATPSCLHRVNTEQCPVLMSAAVKNLNEDCDCHDFCNGAYVGCRSSCPDDGNWVRGCTLDDIITTPRTLQSVNFGSNPTTWQDPCPAGSFSNGPGFPCNSCLSCQRNARPLVSCVKNAADPEQCECLPGFIANGRGGCPPDRPDVGSGSLDVCPVGQYRPNPNGPCVACLSCGANAFPKTNCVQNASDPNQCGCNPGFQRSGSVCVVVATTIGSGSLGQTPCQEGFFRSSPEATAPCVPCLSCAYNAFPLTNCVIDAADPNQCQCNPGLTPNGRGGCLPSPTIGGGSLGQTPPPCQVGFFRSSPEPTAPCVPCLSCARNGFPKTNCVQNAADPNQCGCNQGYRPNGRGGCLPISSTSFEFAEAENASGTQISASISGLLAAALLAMHLACRW